VEVLDEYDTVLYRIEHVFVLPVLAQLCLDEFHVEGIKLELTDVKDHVKGKYKDHENGEDQFKNQSVKGEVVLLDHVVGKQ